MTQKNLVAYQQVSNSKQKNTPKGAQKKSYLEVLRERSSRGWYPLRVSGKAGHARTRTQIRTRTQK